MTAVSQPARADGRTLADVLLARVRASSDRRLAIDAGAGLVAAVVLALTRPPLWLPLALLAVGLAAYGVWGIADRELGEHHARGESSRWLPALRMLAATTGILAAVGAGVLLFFGALGTWIS